jgi:hypothetical protein
MLQKEEMKIINYRDIYDIDIQFSDGTIIYNKRYDHFKDGKIKNPNYRSICGVGFFGIGDYTSKDVNNKHTIQYQTWIDMLKRCYDKRVISLQPSYIDKFVCDEWHNFQNFAMWFDSNHYSVGKENVHLDKDILCKGNKVYSPDRCVFVPQSINNLFLRREKDRGEYPIGVKLNNRLNKYESVVSINRKQIYLGCFDTPLEAFRVYKFKKEQYIKQIANQYIQYLPSNLYNALINYQVEIDD